jgi:uncharacterized damage-inducible protein DinB
LTVRTIAVNPLPGYPHRIGAAMWRMEDNRRRTLVTLEGLDPEHFDIVPDGLENSIGTLLYHVAAVETDWLYTDILGEEFPDWVAVLFPHDGPEHDGRLTHIGGLTAEDHLTRLATARDRFSTEMRRLDDEYLDRVRPVAGHMVSPGWVLHHLREHEAEHCGQIQSIRTVLENRRTSVDLGPPL